jgi:hypothetical protein
MVRVIGLSSPLGGNKSWSLATTCLFRWLSAMIWGISEMSIAAFAVTFPFRTSRRSEIR